MGKSLENFELKCSMRWFTSFEYHLAAVLAAQRGEAGMEAETAWEAAQENGKEITVVQSRTVRVVNENPGMRQQDFLLD